MIQVRRNYFYYSPTHTLRYHEVYPEECEKKEFWKGCNCTKDIKERPEGEHSDYSFNVKHYHKDKYEISGYLTDYVDLKISHGKDMVSCHFGFNATAGGPLKDCLTIHGNKSDKQIIIYLYKGNKVDTNCFFNGHSPTKVVDKHQINYDNLWTHACWAGKETYHIFSKTPYVEKCVEVIKHACNLSKLVSSYDNPDLSVKEISDILNDSSMVSMVLRKITDWLIDFYENFEDNNVIKICKEVQMSLE